MTQAKNNILVAFFVTDNWCMDYVRLFKAHIRPCRVSRLKQQNMSDKINELVKRRAELLEELSQVTREIEDAQTEVFRHIAGEKILVQRF